MSSRRPFDQALEILSNLVRINSVNPSLVPGGAGEKEIAQFLAAFLKQQGIPAELQSVAPDRFNVVANVPTQMGARTMALDAKTGRVFLATAEVAPPPAGAEAPRRRSFVPGSFTILVVGE